MFLRPFGELDPACCGLVGIKQASHETLDLLPGNDDVPEEWVEEFSGFVDSVKDKHSSVGAELRRSQFEVIDGEKD